MTRMRWTLGFSFLMIFLGLIPGPITQVMAPSALADSFNLKTGAWEMTHTSVMTGTLVPPEVLEKMPPERRAKLEQAMQARSGQPKTHVSKGCLTQQDLDQNRLIKEEREGEDKQCTTTIVSKSSSKLVMERKCPAPHASTSQIAVEAKTPEHVVASIDRAVEGAGKVHVDLKGRWLGASCAEIKDGN
ncbi:MAG: DUF3617 family protein [Nitrospirae bacterium]|nr:DUF3617 family protein [Nitrospirota bacterium]